MHCVINALRVSGKGHEFDTKCTPLPCSRLFRLLCAHPCIFNNLQAPIYVIMPFAIHFPPVAYK
ncbi:MAG: hypothetical protein EOM51_04355 [Clostridia bacterium]|nr:hypothetical protein [Clostridia bacterium]